MKTVKLACRERTGGETSGQRKQDNRQFSHAVSHYLLVHVMKSPDF